MEIKIKNGFKKLGEKIIFDNLNITFNKGNSYLISGINGSGKTVLLKLICGYMVLDKGKVYQDGIEVRNKNNFIENAGIIIENPEFLPNLSLLENLKLLTYMNKNITYEEIIKWINFYQLNQYMNINYKNLSLGTKQKMNLIQAFIHNPNVLILDEPFNALDELSLNNTENYLNSIKDNSIIILTSHLNSDFKNKCDFQFKIIDNNLIKI